MHRPTRTALAARTAAATLAAASLMLVPAVAHAGDSPTTTITTSGSPPTSSPTKSTTSTAPTTTVPTDPTASSVAPPVQKKAETPARKDVKKAPAAKDVTIPTPTLAKRADTRTGTDRLPGADALPPDYGWFLQSRLAAGGGHLSTSFEGTAYPDYGLTADAVLALDAAGTGQTAAKAATAWLETNVAAYTGGGGTEAYAGAIAKLLNVAGAQGVDPADFGGVDLVSTLLGLEQKTGQFKDTSAYGDFSNTLGQALALMGLTGVALQPDAPSVDFLQAQQCSDGGFRLTFGATPCTSDPDATSLAVQALIAVTADDASIDKALDYLQARVGKDGGVGGGTGASAENANSTGLAVQALVAGDRVGAVQPLLGWLAEHQYGCSFPAALRGGFAYDAASYATAQKAGTKATASDQDVRATTQAALGASGVPYFAITSDGADAVADPGSCPATSTVTTTTTVTAAPVAKTVDTTVNAVAATSAVTGDLAYTGAQIWPLAVIALILLVAGGFAVVLTRRGGAHA